MLSASNSACLQGSKGNTRGNKYAWCLYTYGVFWVALVRFGFHKAASPKFQRLGLTAALGILLERCFRLRFPSCSAVVLWSRSA